MNNLYFIDSNIPDISTLILGFPNNVTHVILQADTNGLDQITAYLQINSIKNLDAIHIFSHGSAGELYLGNANITADTLNQNADLLAKIGQSLSTTGDILLYGCNVAQGKIGQQFVETFANLTGADVAASNDLTGATILGGDWDLEFHSKGVIETDTIGDLKYKNVLATTTTASGNEDTIITITLSGGTGAFQYVIPNLPTNGMLYTNSGATTAVVANTNYNSGTFYFKPTANYNGSTSFDFNVLDLVSNTSNSATATITVNAVNDAPIVTAPNSTTFSDTATFNNFPNRTGTISATDAEGQAIVYGIKGGTVSGSISTFTTPYGIASINTSTGAYTFTSDNAKINALSTNTSYNGIIFTAMDSSGAVGESAGWAMSFNSVNDTPVLAAKTITGLLDLITADTFTNKIGNIGATDAEGTTLIYSVTGSSVVSFTVNSISYDLKKTGTYGDFYIKSSTGDYIYDPDDAKINAISSAQTDIFTVIASDSNLSASNTVTVNLSGTNDMPISVLTPDTISFIDTSAWNNFSVVSGTLRATDAENDTLTYRISTGTILGGFSKQMSNYGELSVNTTTGDYTFTPNNAAINALNMDVTITFPLSTFDGVSSEVKALRVDLIGVKDAPVITSSTTGTIAENSVVSSVIYTAAATDVDVNDTRTYSLSGTDAMLLNINSSTGEVTLKTSADYETKASYIFNVIATDSSNLTDNKTVTVSVTNVNEVPVITSGATGIVAENARASTVIYTVSAIDIDVNDTRTYSLSGTDAMLLNINSLTGEVTLKTSADYETKASYIFNVIATDSSNLTDNKTVTVSVTNVNEIPVITSGATGIVAENARANTVIYTASAIDADANDTRTYSLSGTDAMLLNINSLTGEVTLKTSADYETKASYVFNVIATDSDNLTDNKTVTVSVTNVNEAPVLTGTNVTLKAGTEDTAYSITKANLLQGYSDPENDPMSILNLTTEHGILSQSGSNWIFTPDANYNGTLNLSYQISDGSLRTSTINQSLTLTAVNDAPILTSAKTVLMNGVQGMAYNVTTTDLIKGYTDVDGDTLFVSNLVANHGTFAANGNDWTFTSTPNYGGAVTFTYNVIDGHGGSVAANQSFSLLAPTFAQGAQVDTLFKYDAKSAFSTTAGTATYSVASLPSWLTFNALTVTFTGTPHLVDLGTSIISITKKVATVNSTINLSVVVEPFKMGNVKVSSDSAATIVGGSGIDTVSYYYSPNAVTVTLPNSNAGTGKLAQVENLIGSQFSDSLKGNIFANVLDGGAGANTLTGGAGNDIYIVQSIDDKIVELVGAGTGMDTVFTTVNSFLLPANVENFVLLGSDNLTAIGNSLSNKITGNSGNNTIIGGGGGDWLLGGKGNDIYVIKHFNLNKSVPVTVEELKNEGIDSVEINTTYTLPINVENLTLTDTGNFDGVGNDLANIVNGNSGNNKLYGLNGNDTIDGGLGKDTLTGGTGKDVFKFSTNTSASNIDTITDFIAGTDKIHLSKTTFTSLNTTGNLPANEIGSHIIYNKATGILSYDADGSAGTGLMVQIALLGNYASVSHTDFVVIA